MSQPNPRAKTSLAVEIAQVHRDRFNEAVAAGHYECAPRTLRGTTRLFEVDDIIALHVYGRLVEEGVLPRNAGAVACEMLRLVLQNDVIAKPVDEVIEVKTSFSRVFLDPAHHDWKATHYGGAEVIYRRVWALGPLRARIIERLEWERDNLGKDDE